MYIPNIEIAELLGGVARHMVSSKALLGISYLDRIEISTEEFDLDIWDNTISIYRRIPVTEPVDMGSELQQVYFVFRPCTTSFAGDCERNSVFGTYDADSRDFLGNDSWLNWDEAYHFQMSLIKDIIDFETTERYKNLVHSIVDESCTGLFTFVCSSTRVDREMFDLIQNKAIPKITTEIDKFVGLFEKMEHANVKLIKTVY